MIEDSKDFQKNPYYQIIFSDFRDLKDYSKINDYIKFSDMLKIGSLKINRGIVFSLIFNWIIYIITNQFVKLITNIFLPKNNSKLDMSQFILGNTLEII